jgi:hypothetical protein
LRAVGRGRKIAALSRAGLSGRRSFGHIMKRSLLTAFRAIAFAVGAFILLAVGGIKVHSSLDVAEFVIGLAVFWVVIEKIFLSLRKSKPRP